MGTEPSHFHGNECVLENLIRIIYLESTFYFRFPGKGFLKQIILTLAFVAVYITISKNDSPHRAQENSSTVHCHTEFILIVCNG